MAEYRLSPAAEDDLEAIWSYTYQQWGLTQAHHYIDTLVYAFAELAETPQLASSAEHIRPGYRRRVVERHVIYFRLTAYGVAIVRILHERMDASRHL